MASDLRLVRVDWLDAWANHDESSPKDWRDEQPMTTVGYVVRETKKVISIANEICHGDEAHADETKYRCVTHLPRAYVVRIVDLRDATTTQPVTLIEE